MTSAPYECNSSALLLPSLVALALLSFLTAWPNTNLVSLSHEVLGNPDMATCVSRSTERKEEAMAIDGSNFDRCRTKSFKQEMQESVSRAKGGV